MNILIIATLGAATLAAGSLGSLILQFLGWLAKDNNGRGFREYGSVSQAIQLLAFSLGIIASILVIAPFFCILGYLGC
jgi:hypothetical protein